MHHRVMRARIGGGGKLHHLLTRQLRALGLFPRPLLRCCPPHQPACQLCQHP